MLADAEVEVAAAVVAGREVAGALERQPGLGRGRQVGRAADQPRDVLGERVEHLRRRTSRPATPFGSAGNVGRSLSQPVGQLAAAASGRAGRPARDTPPCTPRTSPSRRPRSARPRAPMPCLEVLVHAVRHEELRVLAASRRPPWSAGSPPRRAARRGRRACPACSASRRRCGCPR